MTNVNRSRPGGMKRQFERLLHCRTLKIVEVKEIDHSLFKI